MDKIRAEEMGKYDLASGVYKTGGNDSEPRTKDGMHIKSPSLLSGESIFSFGTSMTSGASERAGRGGKGGNEVGERDQYDRSDNPFATFFFAQATDYVGEHEGSRFFYCFPPSRGRVIDEIACGDFHCLAITNAVDGSRLYSWGDSRSGQGGQLGRVTSSASDCATPGLVAFPGEGTAVAEESKYKVLNIACGATFSMLVISCNEMKGEYAWSAL